MVQVGEKKFVAPIEHLGTIHGVEVAVKREDLLHPEVSGNKWYKLVYHIERALDSKAEGIATFGGAYSNHLLATAAYCAQQNLNSIGFVRGEETTP
jgi:1-aminocyclopropane-1-carboxylate deaminase